MMHLTGPDRAQTLLLPESLDEYVGPDNPVRFIDAFVDGLDLAAAGFIRVQPKMTGRPGYGPKDLLKLYIYGTSIASGQAVVWKPKRIVILRSSGCCVTSSPTLRPSPISGVSTAKPSVRSFANSCCCAVNWICSAANCSP
jgi:hypothetical protein